MTYGTRPKRQGWNDDARYHTAKWRKTRAAVLRRDMHQCRIVAGCPTPATVADHIEKASLDTPDWLFYSMSNLRAGCVSHNLGRGNRERDVVPTRNEYARRRTVRFSTGVLRRRPPLVILSPFVASATIGAGQRVPVRSVTNPPVPVRTITADYSVLGSPRRGTGVNGRELKR